jgi:predicted CXXCH cytochrome family protein
VLGLRETPVHVGHVPVDDETCAGCHDNPDDRHPIHRFAEPRFAEARRDIGADRCVSCHGEHGGGRVTVDGIGFCVECHAEMEVEDDPASPSHAELVADERWTTCLGCHDFHGNHVREVPNTLDAALGTDAIEHYFGGGPSPYGEEKRVTADRASAPPGGTR